MEMISNHFMSLNKFSRPCILYHQPRVNDPAMHFYYLLPALWVLVGANGGNLPQICATAGYY
jgi:hypothetical protein